MIRKKKRKKQMIRNKRKDGSWVMPSVLAVFHPLLADYPQFFSDRLCKTTLITRLFELNPKSGPDWKVQRNLMSK